MASRVMLHQSPFYFTQAMPAQREGGVMPPVVKLSAAERIINALIHLPRKRADDFMARQQKEAAVIRPIVDEFVATARREGVIEGLEWALGLFPKPNSTTQWDARTAIYHEIERLRREG